MGKLWMKIWVWIKVSVFGLMALYVLVFVGENIKNETIFWYAYNREIKSSSLTLAFFAFVAGSVTTLLVRTTLSTVRQFREMKERIRQERMTRDFEEMKAKAERLTPKTATPAPLVPPAAEIISLPAEKSDVHE
jgi:hypothetical protein